MPLPVSSACYDLIKGRGRFLLLTLTTWLNNLEINFKASISIPPCPAAYSAVPCGGPGPRGLVPGRLCWRYGALVSQLSTPFLIHVFHADRPKQKGSGGSGGRGGRGGRGAVGTLGCAGLPSSRAPLGLPPQRHSLKGQGGAARRGAPGLPAGLGRAGLG